MVNPSDFYECIFESAIYKADMKYSDWCRIQFTYSLTNSFINLLFHSLIHLLIHLLTLFIMSLKNSSHQGPCFTPFD